MSAAGWKSTQSEARQGRSKPWILLVVLLPAAVFYLATLDSHGFWFDEVRTANAVRLPFREMVVERLQNGHAPLFFALSRLPASWMGANEVGLRTLPAFFGLLSAALLFAIGRRLAGVWVGAVAAALLLVSPHQVEISQMARSYTLVQSLLLAATLVLVCAERDSWRSSVGFSLPATLALWTHFTAIPVVVAQTLALATARRWRAASAGLAALVLGSPFLVASSRLTTVEERIGWIDKGEPTPWVEMFTYPFVRFRSRGFLTDEGLVILAFGVLILGLIGAWRLSGSRILMTFVWLGPPAMVGIASLAGFPAVHELARYFNVSWAVGTLLVATSLTVANRAGRLVAAAAIGLLAIVSIDHSLALVRGGTHWPARQVARIVSANRGESEVLVLYGYPSYPLRYHYEDVIHSLGRLSPDRPTAGGPPRPGKILEEDVDGVWLFTRSGASPEGTAAVALNELRRRFPEHEVWPVKRGRLVHLWKRNPRPEPTENLE